MELAIGGGQLTPSFSYVLLRCSTTADLMAVTDAEAEAVRALMRDKRASIYRFVTCQESDTLGKCQICERDV